MATFKAGFGRVNITPPLGVGLMGYFHERISDGVLDELEANCLAVNDGENTAIILSCDLVGSDKEQMNIFRQGIANAVNVPFDNVFIACTHTHTGPDARKPTDPETSQHATCSDQAYLDMLARKLATVAQLAITDLADATAMIGRNEVHNVAFIRRFRKKDGTASPFIGFNHPDIIGPIGEPDETVQVLRFDREGKKSIVVVNFQVHADMIGFEKISADFPRYVRETIELVYPDAHCLYYTGTQGNLGGVDPNGDPMLYDKFRVTDRLRRAKHAGRCIAGGVMQIYEKLTPVELGPIRALNKTANVKTSRVTDPEELAWAKEIHDLYISGREDEIPGKGMEKISATTKAGRIIALKDGPDFIPLTVYGIGFGDVAFVGLPGEPFCNVGKNTKKKSPFTMTIPCALTNSCDGYFPDLDAFDGGYETASSNFAPGVAEAITETAVELLNELK